MDELLGQGRHERRVTSSVVIDVTRGEARKTDFDRNRSSDFGNAYEIHAGAKVATLRGHL
jgi:hypothetical protein